MKRSNNKSDGFAGQHGIWRKMCTKSVEPLPITGQTFFSTSEDLCLPAPSTINPGRERIRHGSWCFNAHAEQKKPQLKDCTSVTQTVFLQRNWSVETREEATVYVHDLDLFVTVQLLDDIPLVLLLGQLCKNHGISYELAWKSETQFLLKMVPKFFAKQKNTFYLYYMVS